ncbi:MAG: heparinase II/III family protein [Eubacteriales bacterium]|nr:heparinase II/III family protein [Eubacteriales bacterium]
MFSELVKQLHNPCTPYQLPAPASDRAAWESVRPELLKALSDRGLSRLPAVWPQLLAADFLEFSRSGNRVRFEDKQFERRNLLNDLVLAECAEYRGRFLDEIINGIQLICEETAWQLPPHNSYIRDTPQLPYPDVTRPLIDLFAAETGAVLAAARYVMSAELDAVSPLIGKMVDARLRERIFIPYLNGHFWWMGDGVSHMNNWTVWCTQNVLLAAALSDIPEETRRQIVEKACRSIDYFLDEYGEDGCCDEGAQYFRHAGLCLFGCMELLNGMTGGHFSPLCQAEKIRNIASYIQRVHVAGPYYINFADCSPVAGRCSAREFLFGKRTKNPALMQFAAEDAMQTEDPLLTGEHNLWYRLMMVFTDQEMQNAAAHGAHTASGNCPDIFYPSAGLFIARDSRFCLAVKAGDNDDSHNHNDTGSFTVYKDGKPMFADIGVETYQKKTFSPERYSIWTMQSQYHNLPSFTGCSQADADSCPYGYAVSFAGNSGTVAAMEHDGAQYAASGVSWSFDADTAQISMEIAGAYPDPRVRSYKRTARLNRERSIVITDRADCAPLRPVLSLITYETPAWDGQSHTLSVGELGSCRIQGAGRVTIERLPITDPRLQTAWKHDMWRVLAEMNGNELELEIQ